MHGEDENDQAGILRDQLSGQLDAVGIRQTDIDNNRIRSHFLDGSQPLGGITGLLTNEELIGRVEDSFQSLPHENMIINDNDALAPGTGFHNSRFCLVRTDLSIMKTPLGPAFP